MHVSSKKKQQQDSKNTQALATASAVDITHSLGALTSASLKVQSTFSKMSEELIQQHAELEAVSQAIELKKEELKTLHGVDSILLTIDEAKAQHTQTLAGLEAEKAEFLKQIAAKKVELEIERKREADQFNYNLQLSRKNEADQFSESLRLRNNQERDRSEAFEKDLKLRDATLAAKEFDYQAALAKSATFDETVKKEVDKAVAIATNSLKKDYEHEKQVTAIQAQAALNGQKSDNQRLVDALNNVTAENKELREQLKTAQEAQINLAKEAVAGAANAKTVADMQSLFTNTGGGGNGTRPRG